MKTQEQEQGISKQEVSSAEAMQGLDTTIERYDHNRLTPWECTSMEMFTSWGSAQPRGLHRHAGEIELCYLAAGQRVYVDRQRTCALAGGAVWCNRSDVPHSSVGRPTGAAKFYCFTLRKPLRGRVWCGFDYDQAMMVWNLLQERLDPAAHNTASPQMIAAYERFFEVLRNEAGEHDMIVQRAILNSLVSTYFGTSLHPTKAWEGSRAIREMVDKINAMDPREPIRLIDFAKAQGVSLSYFVNAFAKIVGQTPGQYLIGRRLESAARHLALGERIADVSKMFGYDSTQHFTRAFKAYFLETPRKYYLRVSGKGKEIERKKRREEEARQARAAALAAKKNPAHE